HGGRAARPAAQSGRHGPRSGCDGEVHDVPAAHRGGQGPGPGRRAAGAGRRYADGVSADLSDPGDHLRELEGPGLPGLEAVAVGAGVPRAPGHRNQSPRDLSQEGGAGGASRAGWRARRGAQVVSAPPAGTTSATWADVNADVERTLLTAGNTYFAWMTLIALILACGVAAWGWQIW